MTARESSRLFPVTVYGSRFTAFKRHGHAALARPECDARLRLDRVAGREAHPPAARERGEEEYGLRPCEALADAAAHAAAEGEVGELRARLSGFRSPAFGVEAFGVGAEARVAVHDVLADEDD